MPVISFASSKGGAGKTTSAIVLGVTLSRSKRVTIIDADPAKRLYAWSRKAPLPESLTVRTSGGERHVHDEIEEARKRSHYVLMDLEGAASRLNAYVMAESDLVIVPMGDEQQDAEGAIETLDQVRLESRALRREIPVRILFVRTKPAVKSRLERSINEQVRAKVGCFETELVQRTAYSSLHNLGGTLYGMFQHGVTGVAKAIANAEILTEELEETMRRLECLGLKDRRKTAGEDLDHGW